MLSVPFGIVAGQNVFFFFGGGGGGGQLDRAKSRGSGGNTPEKL